MQNIVVYMDTIRAFAAILSATALSLSTAPVSNAQPSVFTGMTVAIAGGERTLGPLVDNPRNGDQGFLTSAHCSDGKTQVPVYSRMGSRRGPQIGVVTGVGSPSSVLTDYAFVAVGQRYIDPRISGGFVPRSLKFAKELVPGETLVKQGRTTGGTHGTFIRLDSSLGIITSPMSYHGDSGSAVYSVTDEYVSIVGLIRGRDSDTHTTEGYVTPIENALRGLGTRLSVYEN